jgi:hypothetical protein
MFLFHDSKEAIQIFQARHIAHDRRNVFLNERGGLFQLFLSAPVNGDEKPTLHGGVVRARGTNPVLRIGFGITGRKTERVSGVSEGARRASADAPDTTRFREG